ncbi:MAG: hypothetical protein AMXMBFR84_42240 [Candidatus Hydrogenedentota bacterium]
MTTLAAREFQTILFQDFLYLLREFGVPAGTKDLIDLNKGIDQGVVSSLDDLYVFMRLTFVRRVEHMDAFERAFLLYFFGIDVPPVAEGDLALLRTKAFKDWLRELIESGKIPEHKIHQMTPHELMDKFWETLREQMKAHAGGTKWIGQRGNSPFGHTGNAERGIRVEGVSRNRSALSVIANRRYLAYADTNTLRGDNLRQALESMKHMRNEGPYTRLNLDETIRRTAANGGEIDIVFERDLRDRIRVVLLVDNGGFSMDAFIERTRLLFSKMRSRFEDLSTYYFHNTIYQNVWSDFRRTRKYPVEQLLLRKPDTRFVFVGDATMAPEELEMPFGNLYYYERNPRSSLYWLRRIADRFPHAVWLNPLPRESWERTHGSHTLGRIREIFHMEDMTLGGIKGMVERLSER